MRTGWTVLFAGIAACLALLTALAVAGALLPGEIAFSQGVQETPGGGRIEEIADGLALPVVEYVVVGAVAALALRRRDYALAATALLALLAMSLNPAFKEIVRRDRPSAADLTIREHPSGYGFPSGHVQSATLVYGYAVIVARQYLRDPAATLATAASLLAIALIAFDRVYNGVHWPTDVLGGATIGVLLLAAAVLLPRRVRPRVA
jgi:membrane-associated phospholipid phosphatase